MEILAHRGWWDEPYEKNTMPAFIRAFEAGLGVELDIRDLDKQIVISHDSPGLAEDRILFLDFLEIWREFDRPKLAINIKSDGLSDTLSHLFTDVDLGRYFFFDMSTPETVQYLKRGLTTAGRLSEFESQPLSADVIWLDAFETDWWLAEDLIAFASSNIYLVSPDLHGRPHDAVWHHARGSRSFAGICTDKVEEAIRYFGEKI